MHNSSLSHIQTRPNPLQHNASQPFSFPRLKLRPRSSPPLTPLNNFPPLRSELEVIRDPTLLPLSLLTSMSFQAFAAAALLAGTTSVSLAAPAAHASDFGIYGACDSIDISETWNGAGARIAGRDCRDARTWKSNENALDRNHATQTQLIGFGGNLLTGLILNSQNQNREPQRSATSEAELAIMRQQQEIELLKLQLQMQQRQTANYGPYGAGINVQNVQPMPGYPQSPYGHAY